MTDTKDTDNQGRRPLSISRKSDKGTVKQSFSHGRSKNVIVETKKKRVVVSPGSKPSVRSPGAKAKEASPLDDAQKAAKKLGLSEAELKARQAALAKRKVDEEKRRSEVAAQEEADRKRKEEARRIEEENEKREAATAKVEEEKAAAERAAARKTTAPSRDAKSAPSSGQPKSRNAPDRGARPIAPEEAAASLEPLAEIGGRIKRPSKPSSDGPSDNRSPSRTKSNEPKRRQKLTVSRALDDDDDRQRSVAAVKRARAKELARRQAMAGGNSEKIVREVTLPETISVSDLANRMSERLADVVKYMMKQGELVRGSDMIDADTAELIIEEFGHIVNRVAESDVEIGLDGVEDDPTTLKPRPPVVTVMGHVDHGKTSLLDSLRATDVVGGEAGGITQHIGAYQVQLKSGERITFLDTPGHAAFSAMRARGANSTDIVILVVAADDGVMPQTIEAIQHAKASGAPIIVAVNKMDKPEADPNKVLTQLLQYDVQVTAMGGDVEAIEVSALKRTGLDTLTETISLQAELLELKANPDREADGVVIESQLDKGRGAVATLLVQRGTLNRGDIVVAGGQWGKVKALTNERGQNLAEAAPAAPVEVLGLDGTPDPGDPFVVVDNEARAREITDYRQRVKKDKAAAGPGSRASLEQLLSRLKEGAETSTDTQTASFIVKGDVQGSVEAITQSLEKVSTDEVSARVVLGAAGGISESDVQLAITAGAPIVAFNVRANKQARDLAEKEGVEIRYYSVIYDLINDVKDVLSGMLAPEKRETFLGYAEILQTFNISKVGKVAGCRISEGIVKRGCGVRLLRDDVVIHEGELSTLKRFKDEVPEVKQGMECGMGFTNYNDIREGDQIECFQVDMIQRSLDD